MLKAVRKQQREAGLRRAERKLITRGQEIAPFLDSVHARYHRAEFLGSDPICIVREFSDPADREVAALFAALLAYGNVKQILVSLRRLFSHMNGRPREFLQSFHPEKARKQFKGFKHRFTDEEDILCLCWQLHQALQVGTLEDFFLRGYQEEEPDLVQAATRFMDNLTAFNFEPWFDRKRMLAKSSFKHLLPRADKGSACKRVHLFLRWMIRPDDGIDLGLWSRISASKLLFPVDTHILRIGQNLGIISSTTHSLAAAREITRVLRVADLHDPVRYDFSVCRLGILKMCPTTSDLSTCRPCELHDVCQKRKQLDKSARRAMS